MVDNDNEAAERSDGGITLHASFSRKVIRYGDKVVKSSREIQPSEADVMRYVAENATGVPVPRVYEANNGPEPSITMEYIEGDRLDKVWNELPEEQKRDIASQLNQILTELRSLKGGPFETEAQFNELLTTDMVKICPTILRDIAAQSLRTDHEVVFTHADFSPRNIMVKDGRVVGLLDWEFSGWYPEYWEFVKAFNSADHRVTWHNYVRDIFPKCYDAEYICDRFLGTILRH